MRNFLLTLGALFVCAVVKQILYPTPGTEPTRESEILADSDPKVASTPAAPTPVAHATPTPVMSTVLNADPVFASTVWITNEATDWDARWTRRGQSNVFDIAYRNNKNGVTEAHVGYVTVVGNEVRAERPADGTTYKGQISADRSRIDGQTFWRGIVGNWTVRIDLSSVKPVAVTVPQRLAPDGIFFLLRSVSVTTDAGVTGIHPGAELQLIADNGATMRVKGNGLEFEVSKSMATNDLNVAQAAFANDRFAQGAIAQHLARGNARETELKAKARTEWLETERARMAAAGLLPRAFPKLDAITTESVADGKTHGNPLDAKAYNETQAFPKRTSVLTPPPSQQRTSANQQQTLAAQWAAEDARRELAKRDQSQIKVNNAEIDILNRRISRNYEAQGAARQQLDYGTQNRLQLDTYYTQQLRFMLQQQNKQLRGY